MWIPAATAGSARDWIPIGEVARLSPGESYTSIHRSQQNRSVTVVGRVDEEVGNTQEIVGSIADFFHDEVQQEYPGIHIELRGQGR